MTKGMPVIKQKSKITPLAQTVKKLWLENKNGWLCLVMGHVLGNFLLIYLLHTKHHFCCQDISTFSVVHTIHQFCCQVIFIDIQYYTPCTIFGAKTKVWITLLYTTHQFCRQDIFIYFSFTLNLDIILFSNMVRIWYKLATIYICSEFKTEDSPNFPSIVFEKFKMATIFIFLDFFLFPI